MRSFWGDNNNDDEEEENNRDSNNGYKNSSSFTAAKKNQDDDDAVDTSNDEIIAKTLAEGYQPTSFKTMGQQQQQQQQQQPQQYQQKKNQQPSCSRSSSSFTSSSIGGSLRQIFEYPGTKYNMRSSSTSSSSSAATSQGMARPVPRGSSSSSNSSSFNDNNSSATSSNNRGNYYARPPSTAPHTRVPQQPLSLEWMSGHQQQRRHQPSHMCYVPCLLGGGRRDNNNNNNHNNNISINNSITNHEVCVEMMIDTGADSSVISYGLAKQLGLDTHIDRRHRGMAAGIGTAPIIGKIHNVVATFGAGGHVEFYMDFLVLDIPNDHGDGGGCTKLLILGMDQMRKYNCLLDLHKNVIVFGGTGGVEVPMLPPDQLPTYDPRLMLGGGGGDMCTVS